jgi:hypothetical protein
MTRKLPKQQYFVLTIFLILLLSFGLNAQPGAGAGGNPGGGGAPPVPISGIEFLVGAGCLVGIKRSISFLKGLRKSS